MYIIPCVILNDIKLLKLSRKYGEDMKVRLLVISFCVCLSIPLAVSASQNRKQRINLPECLGGICLGKVYESLSKLPGTILTNKVYKCDVYQAIKISKKGKSPLISIETYSSFVPTLMSYNSETGVKKFGFRALFIQRVLKYKFSPLKSKDEQFSFIEELILNKYGRPYKIGQFYNDVRTYYYDVDFKLHGNSNTIAIRKDKDRQGITVQEIFGTPVDYYKTCVKNKNKKQERQDLLPD